LASCFFSKVQAKLKSIKKKRINICFINIKKHFGTNLVQHISTTVYIIDNNFSGNN
jgi:hypothetical protein